MNNTGQVNGKRRGKFRAVKILLISFAAVWAVLLIALQFILDSEFLTRTADRYIKEYVDADVRLGKISASVLESFPYLCVEVGGVSVTYPHGRYSEYDSTGVYGILRGAGRNAAADTLASFGKMKLSVNWLSALTGKIHLKEVSLDRPRMFAHSYGDGAANWNILKSSGEQDESDTSSSAIPPVILDRISLTGHPRIVYTDCADTVFAAVFLKSLRFRGRLNTSNTAQNRLGLSVDSLFVSGRLPADTLAVSVDRFRIKEKDRDMHFDAGAKVFLGMNSYGRLILPVSLKGVLNFPSADVPEVSLKNLEAGVATVRMTGEGLAKFYGDSTYVRAEASVDDSSVDEIIHGFGKNFLPAALDLETDAKVSLTALCDGYYNPSRNSLPELIAEIVIPRSYLRYPDIPDGSIETRINAFTDDAGRLDVAVNEMCLIFGGADVDIAGTASDVMGEDPFIGLDGKATASLGELVSFLPDSLGYSASGSLEAALKGQIKMSQITPYNFYRAELDGYVNCSDVTLSSDRDTLDVWMKSPRISIVSAGNAADGAGSGDAKSLTATAYVDSLSVGLGGDMRASASGASLSVMNGADGTSDSDGADGLKPVIGELSFGKVIVVGSDSLLIGVNGSRSRLKYTERPEGRVRIPVLNLSSDNSAVFASQVVNRYGFRNADLTASAVLATVEQGRRRNLMLDSLSKVYPGVPRDSLFRKMLKAKMEGRPVPDFIAEADFRRSDIRIDLNETLAKYLKEWNVKGGLEIKDGIVVTPYFPLRNKLKDIRCTMSNDRISLDNFTVLPGSSDLTAKGELTGLRRAIGGFGPMKLNLKLTSDRIDANELLSAYSSGSRYVPTGGDAEIPEDMDYEGYLAEVSSEAADSTYSLLVIPANLIADVSLQANEVDWSDLKISWLASDVTMKERCVQMTNTLATSNMGDIYFEGYYSTRSKKDIKAGFDLNMVDITADKVVQLFPAIDTIMPMLTSFKGMLDCEMAATSDIDTNMNFITPSMTGIMKIRGRDVTLEGSPAFSSLARTLMFKNRTSGTVGDMSVSGLIGNDRLEIFPFVLKIDRYTLAMSGMQNFDQSFNYHVSVLKSPVPFRFGINLTGNFDKWKYRICKAKYKTTDVPVFTSLIDTMQLNLVQSIHNIFSKGVDLAVKQNRAMRDTIDSRKYEMGFEPEAGADSLGGREMAVLDSLNRDYEQPVDSLLNERINSLQIIGDGSGEGEEDSRLQKFISGQLDRRAAAEERRAARRQRRADSREARAAAKLDE